MRQRTSRAPQAVPVAALGRSWRTRCLIPLAVAGAAALSACGSQAGSNAAGSPFGGQTSPGAASAAPTAAPSTDPTVVPTGSAAPAVTPPPTAAPSSTAPSSSAPTPSPSPTKVGLTMGDRGPAVLALQQKLQSLGFWLSAADSSYGQTTEQAVMAFQKAKGLQRDGVAGPQTLTALKDSTAAGVTPQSTAGHWLEIDKTRQLLYVVDDGAIKQILNTSTGSNTAYTSGGVTSIASTPSGQFAVFRQVDRLDPGPLGDLWRPKYFNGGIAVHGSPSIPGYPASHGCARLSNPAIDWIWSSGQAPIGTKVWVY